MPELGREYEEYCDELNAYYDEQEDSDDGKRDLYYRERRDRGGDGVFCEILEGRTGHRVCHPARYLGGSCRCTR